MYCSPKYIQHLLMTILNSLSGESSIPIAIRSVSEATFLKRITPVLVLTLERKMTFKSTWLEVLGTSQNSLSINYQQFSQ